MSNSDIQHPAIAAMPITPMTAEAQTRHAAGFKAVCELVKKELIAAQKSGIKVGFQGQLQPSCGVFKFVAPGFHPGSHPSERQTYHGYTLPDGKGMGNCVGAIIRVVAPADETARHELFLWGQDQWSACFTGAASVPTYAGLPVHSYTELSGALKAAVERHHEKPVTFGLDDDLDERLKTGGAPNADALSRTVGMEPDW